MLSLLIVEYKACSLLFVNDLVEILNISFSYLLDASVKHSQRAASQLSSSPDSTSKPHSHVIKRKSERNVKLTAKYFSREKSNDKGNVNAKRGFSERDSGPWSVKSDTSLPQPQQYDDMGGKWTTTISNGNKRPNQPVRPCTHTFFQGSEMLLIGS